MGLGLVYDKIVSRHDLFAMPAGMVIKAAFCYIGQFNIIMGVCSDILCHVKMGNMKMRLVMRQVIQGIVHVKIPSDYGGISP